MDTIESLPACLSGGERRALKERLLAEPSESETAGPV